MKQKFFRYDSPECVIMECIHESVLCVSDPVQNNEGDFSDVVVDKFEW